MNTADRSVEALDTALRRRFVFEPKMPKEDELTAEFDEINLQVLLSTINKRLRILKDNDHTIGHAWLMGIENLEQLKAVFEKKIIPLLQEYFYNDYEKLGLVLGNSFFNPTKKVNGSEFAIFSGSNGLSSQYKSKFLYELKDMSTLTSADFLALIGVQTEDEE
jgi:5-methylcytosine-specific restriction endonuclease McrBC GTP-binding regulatory subunit McrB